MTDATIIVGKLDDKALRDQIESLVTFVNGKTNEIATSFNNALGSVGKSTKGTGGSNARVQQEKEVQKAVKETEVSYDNQAKAVEKATAGAKRYTDEIRRQAAEIQNAVAPKSARESFYAFQQGFREQANQIGVQIREAEVALNKAVESRVNELNTKLANAKAKLNELRVELARQRIEAERAGNFSMYNAAIARTTSSIENLKKHIAEIQRRIAEAPNMFGQQVQNINALRAEQERVLNIMRDETTTNNRVVESQQQQTRELDKQLQKIKEINSAKEAKAVFQSISAMPADTIEQANAKLRALQSLKEGVSNTPLLSKANQSELLRMIDSMKVAIERLNNFARGTNQSKESIEAMNRALEENKRRWSEQRREILRTRQAVQDEANKVATSVLSKMSAKNDIPIPQDEVKKLTDFIEKLTNAYHALGAAAQESSIGKALAADIKRIVEARNAALEYNRTLRRAAFTELAVPESAGITNKSTIDALRTSLKNLTDQYNQLTVAELNAGKGDKIAQQFQNTTRAVQLLQKTLSRPVSLKAAMGLQERSLDDIAYKIQQLRAYLNGLDWRKQGTEIKAATVELQRLEKQQNAILGKNKRLINSNDALSRSWNYMKNRLAFYLTVGASTSFVRQLAEIRGQYEMTEKALGVLIGSAQKGSQVFRELSGMALISPYTLIELSNAARQLSAYGVEAKNLVDTTRRLADISAAVGAPIENIAYALGHVQSYGHLTSLQARQFANAGIPLVKELAKRYTELEGRIVSVSDVYARMKHKQVEYADVMGVVNSMTDEGGRFFGFQEKMAGTLRVQLANLSLAWNNMLNDIGKSNQGLLSGSIGALKELFLHWQSISTILKEVAIVFGVYKAAMIGARLVEGASITQLDRHILATKKKVAADLERKAMTKSLTFAEKQLLVSSKQINAAEYANALATKNITKGRAAMMVIFNRNNAVLHKALVSMGLLTKAEIKNMTVTKALGLAFKGLGAAVVNFGRVLKSNLLNIGLFIILDIVFSIMRANEEVEELNKNIAEAAKENAKSIKESLASFKQNVDVSTPEAAAKSWEEIRDAIEQSSAAGAIFIDELMKNEDVAARVSQAIDYAEKIKQANGVLGDLTDNLEISTDTWGGIFGEGLAEDLDDLNDHFERLAEQVANAGGNNTDFAANHIWTGDLKEAEYEVAKLGEEIERLMRIKFTPEQLADPVIVREAIETFRKQLEIAYPKISGAVKDWFAVDLDKDLAKRFGKVVDVNATTARIITDKLVRDHSNAFQNIADGAEELTDKQRALIEKVINDYKTTMPDSFKESIDEMWQHMKDKDWTIRIRYALGVPEFAGWQKEFNDKFVKVSPDEVKNLTYRRLMPKATESMVEHEKRLSDEYKETNENLEKNRKILKSLGEAESERRREVVRTINALETQKKSIEDIAGYGGYNLSDGKNKKKNTGRTTKPEDEVAKALKDELSLIKEMQSNYDKLRKSGVDATTALDIASSGYEGTLRRINAVLTKYGIAEFKSSSFVGKDANNPHTLLDALRKQRADLLASGKVKTASLKDLDVEIQKLTVEAKTYDLKKITDGLNNELGKLKEEYELAVELDANPELGSMFADMFDINIRELPRTFAEMMNKAQSIIDAKIKEFGEGSGRALSPFNVMTDDLYEWGKGNRVSADSEIYKILEKTQQQLRDTFKKNLVETEKILDDYVKKYGDYSDKIAEIEMDRLEKLKRLNETYWNDTMRNTDEYRAKLNAIEMGAKREKGQVRWDEFKGSDLYVTMFQNLQYTSTRVLEHIRKKLASLRQELGSLNPEQVKQIAEQMEKIDSELIKRNPYKNLNETIREGINALKQRKKAQQDYANVVQRRDEIRENLDNLEEQRKQALNDGDQEAVDLLDEQIRKEKEALKTQENRVQTQAEINSGIRKSMKDAGESLQAGSTGFSNFANAAVEIRDSLASVGITFSDNINGAIDGLAEAAQGFFEVVSSLFTGNVFGVVAGGIKGLIGIGKTFVSLFAGGKKDYYTGLKEQVDRLNSILEKSVSNQLETLGKLSGPQAVKEYKKLVELNKMSEKSYRDLANAGGQSGSSAGAHSYATRSNRRLENDWRRISKIVGQTVNSVQDLYNLDADKLKDLMTYAPEIWAKLSDEIREPLESVIEAGEKAAESAERFREALSNLTLDSLNTDIENLLADPEATLETGMDNLDGYLRKTVARRISTAYAGRINKWYEEYADLWQKDNVSQEELNQHYKKYEALLQEMLEERQRQYQQLGQDLASSKELSALQQGIQNITEDTAGAIEAYLNGVSQQVYYQSDMLTQIRNAVIGFDMDIANGTRAQMLLQLQQSYQIQQGMYILMQNWTNPAGNAVKVELIS